MPTLLVTRWSRSVPLGALHMPTWQLESVGDGVHVSFWKEGENVSTAHAYRLQQCNRRMPCLHASTGFKLGAEECHNHLHFPPRSGGRGMLLSSISMCRGQGAGVNWACQTGPAGYEESALMVSTSTSLFGEHPNCPHPSSQSPQISKWNPLYIQSRHLSNCCFVLGWGQWDNMWTTQKRSLSFP